MRIHNKFRKLHDVQRHRHHPLMHHVHRKHRISYQTIFYMKEYGSRSHAAMTIIRESIKIVIFAAVISSIGGIGLEHAKGKFAAILPLLVMIPALNDMIGDYGTIVASKFTSMIYTGRINLRSVWASPELRRLAKTVFTVAFLSAIYMAVVSYAAAYYAGFPFNAAMFARIAGIAMLCTMALVSIIFVITVLAGIYVYRRREDPNNFLIPVTTALADLGSMLLFAYVAVMLF